MLIVYPDYYKDFSCIAGDCEDTCCAGWEIVIDPKSLKRYVSVQHRSQRNRADRENMIQECENPIVEDDFHGFSHRNCEGTEQLR